MDRNRFILALTLSLVVLVAWQVGVRYFYPPAPQPPITETFPQIETPKTPAKQATPAPQLPTVSTTSTLQREIEISTPYWKARFSSKGAVATSWVIEKYQTGGVERRITSADGGELELVPRDVIGKLGAPFSIRLPWAPDLAAQLNQANFDVNTSEEKIELRSGDQREVTFTYSSPGVVARKTFKFYGDGFIVDVTAKATSPAGDQVVGLVLGPRIGDQSDKRTNGSYSTPAQVIAFNTEGKRESVVGASITKPFGKITAIDPETRQIQIDKPLAGGVDEIRIVAGDEHVLVGNARVLNREGNSQVLTLDSVPPLATVGSGIAQATDTLRKGYVWAGIVDHYFTMVAIPRQPIDELTLSNAQLKTLGDDQPPREYPSVAVPVRADSETHIFIGPKDRLLLAEVGGRLRVDLEALIDYGFFSFMVRPIVPAIGWALDGLARVFHNYGWSIVGVTIVINLFLSPLRFYSSKKMKKAAKHQPRLKELQERMKKLKDSPKKSEREMLELQKEQMALMKEANPLGGCLPMLLQMPIFWAFFIYLTISLDVRHAPWILWIKDLSTADPYHVLPIVMCVTMIASTKLTPQPASADPSMKMQRIMMTWLMPIMLTFFFFLSAPSGLVLYWMVSNVVGVVVQLVINRITTEPEAEGPPDSGTKTQKTLKRGQSAPKASDKAVVGSAR
jgi:YidC/Oxa1 family membrane protein insertase